VSSECLEKMNHEKVFLKFILTQSNEELLIFSSILNQLEIITNLMKKHDYGKNQKKHLSDLTNFYQ